MDLQLKKVPLWMDNFWVKRTVKEVHAHAQGGTLHTARINYYGIICKPVSIDQSKGPSYTRRKMKNIEYFAQDLLCLK